MGTRVVEPPNWSSWFFEVRDTGLKDGVLRIFAKPKTQTLPWQEEHEEHEQHKRTRTKGKRKTEVFFFNMIMLDNLFVNF